LELDRVGRLAYDFGCMLDMDERKALRDSAVLVDDGDDVLRATGNDRTSFLQRITSGKVGGLPPGQGGPTLLLDVRGRVLSHLLVFVRPKSVRLLAARGQGTGVVEGLGKYAIMDDFQIVAEPELTSLAVLGPAAAGALVAAGVPVPDALAQAQLFAHQEIAGEGSGTLWLARIRRCGADGILVVAPASVHDAVVTALLAAGIPRLSAEVAEVARIGALEPAPGNEITPDRFPVEIGLGTAIDHGKGCYVGQETIVRMRDRGIVRKRLVRLHVAGEGLPAPGDKVTVDGQPAAGQVTSAARLAGEPAVALAIVANTVAVGATVQIEHGGGSLTATVDAESSPWG
jgi:folate-binding protein YgfZ